MRRRRKGLDVHDIGHEQDTRMLSREPFLERGGAGDDQIGATEQSRFEGPDARGVHSGVGLVGIHAMIDKMQSRKVSEQRLRRREEGPDQRPLEVQLG
jgi:hypothetical protein